MAEERLLWEDLAEGDAAVSGGRTITETDVVNFAGLSGDFNWFHIDAVAATESVFGQRVAHGMLVLSIATGLQVGHMEPKIATAAFMVDPAHQGRGVGRALCRYAVDWARTTGYHAMQFNAVVETNTGAVSLWRSLGFEILATVPEAFRHRVHGLVGLHVMYQRLAP